MSLSSTSSVKNKFDAFYPTSSSSPSSIKRQRVAHPVAQPTVTQSSKAAYNLPNDAWQHIFSFLPFTEIAAFAICKQLREVYSLFPFDKLDFTDWKKARIRAFIAQAPASDTVKSIIGTLSDEEFLPLIGKYKNIEEIDFAQKKFNYTTFGHIPKSTITDISLNALRSLNNLRSLNINFCYGLSLEGMKVLGQLKKIEKLTFQVGVVLSSEARRLDVQLPATITDLCIRSSMGLSFPQMLSPLKQLTRFDAAYTSINRDGLIALSQEVTSLDLNGCISLERADFQILGCFQKLQTLSVASAKIGSEAIALLSPTLTDMNICLCRNIEAESLADQLPKFTLLQRLNASYTPFDDVCLAAIPRTITDLNLTKCDHITKEGLQACVSWLTQLRCLRVDIRPVTDAIFPFIPRTLRKLEINSDEHFDRARRFHIRLEHEFAGYSNYDIIFS